MNPIIISLSKIKLTFLFLGCVALTIFGIWMFMNPNHYYFEYDPRIIQAAGLFFAVAAGIQGLKWLRWLVSSDGALTIKDEGIIDNCSMVKVGLIRWQNITGVDIDILKVKKSRHRILVIKVNNMEELLKDKHLFTKLRVWMNTPWGKDKVRINTGMFKIGLDELKELIEGHWKERTWRSG